MPKKTKPNLFLHYKIAFGVITVVLLLFGVILVAQGFIDTRVYREEIVRIIHEQTGKDVIIKGPVSISLLPTQSLFVSGIELRDSNNDAPGPSITVERLRIDVALLSVLSPHPQISNITLQHPVLEVTRAADNIIHWDWLTLPFLKSLAKKQDTAANSAVAISIDDGKIIYYDSSSEKATPIDNIRAYATLGKNPTLQGSFTFAEHNLQFTLDSKSSTGSSIPSGATPLNLSLFADAKNTLKLQGSIDLSTDTPKIQGKVNLQLGNVLTWVKSAAHNAAQQAFDPFALVRKPSEPKTDNHLSMSLSGDWVQDGLNVEMTHVQMEGLDSIGKGSIALHWLDWKPSFKADMQFSALNYDQWKVLAISALNGNSQASGSLYDQQNQSLYKALPNNFQMTLAIAADQLMIGSQTWQNAQISAQLADAAITIDQFHIELPGEAKLGLFGVISQGGTGGLRFEGSMETAGKSLRQLLTIFNESASDLPETGFGDFYVHSNIFVSPEQMRLSEADVKISDLKLNGGLVAYFDSTNPRLEADVHLKDINFDYFRDIWREKQKLVRTQSFFLQFDKGTSFNWLKKLQTTIDLKVNVDGFTFLERKGDSASFRLFVRQNEFGIYDVLFNYPQETTAGGFRLDVTGDQPYVDVTLNTDVINTDYFGLGAPADAGAAKEPDAGAKADKQWSKDLIDMSWMEGFNGAFNLSIDKLTHGPMKLNQVKLQAKLERNLLTFQNFNFDYWQARCSVLGAIYGGKVPGISVSFTLYNAELGDALKSLTRRDNLTGKVNINGTLTTSGVNPLSWVEQSDAKIIMNGNVHVQGLNMQGVVDAVGVSRTAADVLNNVNLALVKGATDFEVGGNINVKNGMMQTPGISLKTGTIIGNFQAELNLVPWTMNTSTLFQFPALSSETVPTLTVQLVGPFDAPELRTDTSSLEAYVTGHIKGG